MKDCPCKGCEAPKRTSTCHIKGNCPEHDEWQRQEAIRKENKRKANFCKDLPRESLRKWWKTLKK